MKIEAIITDFDGTLVDTFLANLFAYQEAFRKVGMTLTRTDYSNCYGLRFDAFMGAMGIKNPEIKAIIKEEKKNAYPNNFKYIHLNPYLSHLIANQHNKGIKTAIASTASKDNLNNIVDFLNIRDMFDYIITGEDVENGKPNPEVYNVAMQKLNVTPEETLIFEDSEAGVQAAEASKANWIKL